MSCWWWITTSESTTQSAMWCWLLRNPNFESSNYAKTPGMSGLWERSLERFRMMSYDVGVLWTAVHFKWLMATIIAIIWFIDHNSETTICKNWSHSGTHSPEITRTFSGFSLKLAALISRNKLSHILFVSFFGMQKSRAFQIPMSFCSSFSDLTPNALTIFR